MTNPFNKVKKQFGSKEKLVDTILGLIKRSADQSKEQFKRTLQSQSNRKLLIMLNREQTVKEQFGTRDKLIEAITKSAKGKADDKDCGKQLGLRTTGQLLDLAKRKSLMKK